MNNEIEADYLVDKLAGRLWFVSHNINDPKFDLWHEPHKPMFNADWITQAREETFTEYCNRKEQERKEQE